MLDVPKLKLYATRGYYKKYVKCPKCDFWSDRYDKKKNDSLGKLCPVCRVKQKLKIMEKRARNV